MDKVIAIVDNDSIQKSDAIVLLEGDGFNRYRKAADLYLDGFANKIVFSGGVVDYDYGSYPFSEIFPRLLDLGVSECDIMHEDSSQNTREQALEAVKLVIKNDWKRIILVATHEHQYRAYLTFLRVVLDSKKEILLFNAPVRNLKWFDDNPWGRRIDRLDQELERIKSYSLKGHLATENEVIKYQEWKAQQA